jgi:hypothetical protein
MDAKSPVATSHQSLDHPTNRYTRLVEERFKFPEPCVFLKFLQKGCLGHKLPMKRSYINQNNSDCVDSEK